MAGLLMRSSLMVLSGADNSYKNSSRRTPACPDDIGRTGMTDSGRNIGFLYLAFVIANHSRIATIHTLVPAIYTLG
ncbi:MAG: hypothetical protein ABI359_05555 [Ginsengibacter sp.]